MRGWALGVLLGGVALAAPPSFLWEGKLLWTLPSAVPAWDSRLEVAWELAGWRWGAVGTFKDAAWRALTLSCSGNLGEFALSPAMTFDPQEARFLGLTVPWKLGFLGLALEGLARLEEKGLGWGLTLVGPRDGLVERVRVRFNLKRSLDEVVEETFAPSFSFGEVWFRVRPPWCVERIRGWLQFTKEGFEELALSFPLPWKLDCGVSFGARLRFRPDEARITLFPSLLYQWPPGVTVFLGLDWDAATSALRGIKVYGLGFHGEVGKLRFRTVTSLAKDGIGLVKDPTGNSWS